MILFLNTDRNLESIIPLNEIASIKVYNIELRNKAVSGPEMLENITSILDAFSYETDKALIVLNNLDIALDNIKDYPEERMLNDIRLFKGLLNQYISVGHEVVFFLNAGETDPELLEFNEIEGCEIITDEIKLYNHMKNHIL